MTDEPPASSDTPPGKFDLAAWLRWWAWRAPALFVVLTIVGAALRYFFGGEAGDLGGSIRGAALFAAILVPSWLIGGELFDARGPAATADPDLLRGIGRTRPGAGSRPRRGRFRPPDLPCRA